MSVAGFDVGNLNSVVGLARRNGIDVVLNSESKRETPSFVNFGPKQRFIGVAAGEKISMEPKSTMTQLKRLIGKKWNDPELQADLPTLNYNVEEGPDNVPCVRVNVMGEQRLVRPEQLMAALLSELRNIAEKDQSAKITDCVIAIPMFFTEAQRRAMLDAAAIIGLNVLRLIHETTATALAYGIYKTDLPADKPLYVAFVDAGNSSLQVSIVGFTKAGLKVMGVGYDRSFGGRNFDEVLYNHLCDEFKTKYKIDIKSNPRASLRMRIQCEKAKKILSSNPEAPFAIECLMNDVDVRSQLTRDQFEELSQSILARAIEPAKAALAESGISVEDIAFVEVVGGCSRAPAMCKALEGFFKKSLSRTMNASEAVARGCALQGAMLSPTFHVTKRFEVEDRFCHSINFTWRQSEEGPEHERTASLVFPQGNSIPSAKMLTFFRSGSFSLDAEYADMALLPAGTPQRVASFLIGPIPVPKAGGKPKLKVKVRLNLHGLVGVENAQIVEEEEDQGADAKMDDAGDSGDVDDLNKEKKKVKKTEVPVVTTSQSLSAAELQQLTEKEFEMALQDRMMEETKERKNAVESYVLDMRSKLAEQLAPYATDKAREEFNSKLQTVEDWLYDEGEDVAKGVYVDKLAELRALGDPIEERAKEDATRGPACALLRKTAEGFAAQAAEERFSHIEAAQLESVKKEAAAALQWLKEKEQLMAGLSKTEPPALLTADVKKKQDALVRFVGPILATPKPKPAEGTSQPMETDAEGPAAGPRAEDLD